MAKEFSGPEAAAGGSRVDLREGVKTMVAESDEAFLAETDNANLRSRPSHKSPNFATFDAGACVWRPTVGWLFRAVFWL